VTPASIDGDLLWALGPLIDQYNAWVAYDPGPEYRSRPRAPRPFEDILVDDVQYLLHGSLTRKTPVAISAVGTWFPGAMSAVAPEGDQKIQVSTSLVPLLFSFCSKIDICLRNPLNYDLHDQHVAEVIGNQAEYGPIALIAVWLREVGVAVQGTSGSRDVEPRFFHSPYNVYEQVSFARRFVVAHELSHATLDDAEFVRNELLVDRFARDLMTGGSTRRASWLATVNALRNEHGVWPRANEVEHRLHGSIDAETIARSSAALEVRADRAGIDMLLTSFLGQSDRADHESARLANAVLAPLLYFGMLHFLHPFVAPGKAASSVREAMRETHLHPGFRRITAEAHLRRWCKKHWPHLLVRIDLMTVMLDSLTWMPFARFFEDFLTTPGWEPSENVRRRYADYYELFTKHNPPPILATELGYFGGGSQ
jgi:hypothetical protein